MAHPRDWFRRRRRDSLALPPDASDPLLSGPVLDLGRSGTMLLDAPEPRLTGFAMETAQPDTRMSGSVPPPPPRERPARAVHVLDRDAFDIRPEIRKAVEAETATKDEPSEKNGAVFTVKKAVPLARRMAAAPSAAPTPPPAPSQGATIHALSPAPPPAPPPSAPEPRAASEEAAESARPPRATVHSLPPTRPQPQAAPRPQPVAAAPIFKPVAPSAVDETDDADLPGFSLAAPGVSWVKSATTLKDVGAMNAVLREAFTPTRPKQGGKLFSGRARQMQRIIAAIEEERAHIVLYGERGSGKTSLANIIMAKAEEAGYFLLRSACSSELSFDEIFRGFLKRIPSTFLADGMGATRAAGLEHFEQLVPPGELHVGDLIQTLSRIHDRHVILVIDEYDRIISETTKNKLAEFIKNMSDASAPVTILLIGVAENIDELLGKHPSLQRTLVTIPLPLMSPKEIAGIIVAGEQKSGLRFEDDVRQAIVDFSQGLPYHAQLLCLFAARSAVRRHSMVVGREDLRYALHRAIEEAEGRVKEAYTVAAGGQGGASFKDAMFAAARCPCDEFGTFTLEAVIDAAGKDGEGAQALQYPLKKLSEPERGGVLRKIATADGLRYQFFNQMMRHYVLVRGSLERGLA